MSLSGIETLHPDVFVIEEQGLPHIQGVGVNTGGFVGVARKGPIDRAELITNMTQFTSKFGGLFQGNYLQPSVQAFFDQGGTRCFVVRVIGVGALAAEAPVVNTESTPAIEASAISPGAWGNDVSLQIMRWSTLIAATPLGHNPAQNGSTEIPVASVRNVQVGDLVYLNDPIAPQTLTAFVYDIDVANRILIVRSITGLPALYSFPVGATVQCATSHRINTRLAADLNNGDTQATLVSTQNLAIGARVYMDNGVDFTSVVVERIDGNIIRFAACVIGGAGVLEATTTIAVSQEFDLRTFEQGNFVELIAGLSMEPTNTRDYFGTRLAGQANESTVITVVDLFPVVVDLLLAIPLPVANLPLTGGTEGAPVSDNDFIGSDVPPISGMFLLDAAPNLNFFSIPGITTVAVEHAAADFATRKADLIAVLDAPLADTEPLDIINYRNIELNVDTSYAALYYPWVIVRDPLQNGARVSLPPSGFVQGQYANIGITRGVQFAPANVVLSDVLDLTHMTTDGEQDLLNPIGINCIRSFPGEGIRIWGARTLTTFFDGRQYVNVRRLLNYIKDSLKVGLRFAVFELNEPRTWNRVTLTVSEFLRGMFLRGQLFSPDGTAKRAFFVKCDAETNPPSEINTGRMNVEVGVNPPLPAEFVIVTLGIFDGGTTADEELAGR